MTTYLINHLRIPGDIPNEVAISYLEQVEATTAPFEGRWLAMGPGDVVEGVWPGAVVLMSFPNRKAATDWYESPEYQTILPLRTGNAISDMILIDALPEGFTVRGFAADVRRATQGG